MKKAFHIHLRAGERIFVNGAVMRADRKVSLEFLNDVDFLLEAHVMQADADHHAATSALLHRPDDFDGSIQCGAGAAIFREHHAALMGVLETSRFGTASSHCRDWWRAEARSRR